MVGKHWEAVVTADDSKDKTLSGFLVFCIHARLRVVDALRLEREPVMDLPSGRDASLIAVDTFKHKTRGRGSRKLCLALPSLRL